MISESLGSRSTFQWCIIMMRLIFDFVNNKNSNKIWLFSLKNQAMSCLFFVFLSLPLTLCVPLSLIQTHTHMCVPTHTQGRLVTSQWKLKQTVNHLTSLIGVISSVRFHLATDDKPHVTPPNRNKGDRDIVAIDSSNETLQDLHRA